MHELSEVMLRCADSKVLDTDLLVRVFLHSIVQYDGLFFEVQASVCRIYNKLTKLCDCKELISRVFAIIGKCHN